MNLFAEHTQLVFTAQDFEDGWTNRLSQYVDAHIFQKILVKVEQERKTNTVFPDEKDVFRIFKDCPYSSIKVVIIGQDPYFNGNANGYAFGCKVNISPSLAKISEAIRAYRSSLGITNKGDMGLKFLVEQGVFLYNTRLTVQEGIPLSHSSLGWEYFTEQVIKTLNEKDNLVWMLWGKEAQGYEKMINTRHLILKAEHPVAAARSNRDWKCTAFADANEYLINRSLTKINW